MASNFIEQVQKGSTSGALRRLEERHAAQERISEFEWRLIVAAGDMQAEGISNSKAASMIRREISAFVDSGEYERVCAKPKNRRSELQFRKIQYKIILDSGIPIPTKAQIQEIIREE